MITINETHIKNVAKQIGILCTEKKCNIKHTAVLDAIAKGMGYKSYNALKPKFNSIKIDKNNIKEHVTESDDFTVIDKEEIEYDTSPLSVHKDVFERYVNKATSLSGGVKIAEINTIMYWLFDDLRTGLHRFSLIKQDMWDSKEFKTKKGLEILIFKYFLSDVLLAANHWNVSKDLKGYIYDEFYEIEANDEHLYSLIKNNLLYDKQLLELLNISEKDFLISVKHARKEDRNMVIYDYK